MSDVDSSPGPGDEGHVGPDQSTPPPAADRWDRRYRITGDPMDVLRIVLAEVKDSRRTRG